MCGGVEEGAWRSGGGHVEEWRRVHGGVEEGAWRSGGGCMEACAERSAGVTQSVMRVTEDGSKEEVYSLSVLSEVYILYLQVLCLCFAGV